MQNLRLSDDDEWKIAELCSNIAKAFVPPKKEAFHDWVEKNYILPPNLVSDGFRGLVSFENAPYLRVIAHAISNYKKYPGQIYQITIQKGSQVYITTIATAASFYFIIVDQQKQLWVFPTSTKGVEWMKMSFKSSWREMPDARRLLGDPDNEKKQQAKLVEYPNGFMKLVTPNEDGALQGTPANILIVDEPSSVDDEVAGLGSTITNLKGRPKNFNHSMLFIGGTPGHVYYDNEGELTGGILTQEFNKSSQQVFHFPCPSCGHITHYPITQAELKERITYNVDSNGLLVEGSSRIVCTQCGMPTINEQSRRQINLKFSGDSEYWKPINPLAHKYHVGFNINTFLSLSPIVSIDNFVREMRDCKSEKMMQAFCNTNGFPFVYSSGESLKEKMTDDKWKRFVTKIDNADGSVFEFDVPMDVNTIVAAADIQDGSSHGAAARIEVVYVGFDIFGNYVIIDHDVFAGSLIKHAKCNSWVECERIAPDGLLMKLHKYAIQRKFIHESGQEIGLSIFGFDITNGTHFRHLDTLINDYPTFVGGTGRFRENPIVLGIRGDSKLKNQLVARTSSPPVKVGSKRRTKALVQFHNRLNVNTEKLTTLFYNDLLNGDVLFSDKFDNDFFDLVMTQIWSPSKNKYIKGEDDTLPNEVDDCVCYARAMFMYASQSFGVRGTGKQERRIPLIDVIANESKFNSLENRRKRIVDFCARHGINIDADALECLSLTQLQPLSQAIAKSASSTNDGKIDTKSIVAEVEKVR